MKILLCAKSERGLRETNDDRAYIGGDVVAMGMESRETDLPAMAAVCDGCGGYAGGGLAAAIVLQTLSGYALPSLLTPEALEKALSGAKDAIAAQKALHPQFRAMCTTIAGCLFAEDRTVFFHSGDSRIYRYDGYTLARMTTDHSLVQRMVDKGELTLEEARVHPRRNVITRCLGPDCLPPEIYVSPTPIAPGETYLICSDGLWEALTDSQLREVLDKDASPEEKARQLVALAMEQGADDNVTLCLCVHSEKATKQEVDPFILD